MIANLPKNLDEWLIFQSQTSLETITLGVERVQTLAMRLGILKPDFQIITIGGTNGKGSSATLCTHTLANLGYQVGLYTSPHLQKYNERIAFCSPDSPNTLLNIQDLPLCDAFLQIEKARLDVPLSYFEWGTLAAMWLFAQAKVDIVVLEVGLGGRLDAVNAWHPDAALLTQIGLDHTDWLGDTREAIAIEKAGIFRAGKPAICAEPAPPANLKPLACDMGAAWFAIGDDFVFEKISNNNLLNKWIFKFEKFGIDWDDLPLPRAQGDHQLQNAAGVLATLLVFFANHTQNHKNHKNHTNHFEIKTSFCLALQNAHPARGRWQKLQHKTAQKPTIWADVAHNEESLWALSQLIQDQQNQDKHQKNPNFAQNTGQWIGILGMLADKPVESVAKYLDNHIQIWFLVDLPPPRGLNRVQLQARLGQVTGAVILCESVSEALLRAQQMTSPDDQIMVFGSFLTVEAAMDVL